ncbi:MAG: low-complexity protein [Proteobacteria bacterium]|nr:low-complexity protein [Pseudomonadota bacterium]
MSTEKKMMAFALTTVFSGACLAAAQAAPASQETMTKPTTDMSQKMAEQKCGEAKCGARKSREHKCGEAKCGEKMMNKAGKSAEHKCGAKAAEHKCGEATCGAAKMILDAAEPK